MHDSINPGVFLALSRTDSLSPALLAALSGDERRTAEDLVSARRRKEFVCARGLLRHLLQKATGLPAKSHVISLTDKGKPICIDGPGVSISHARGIVACGVTLKGDVGIDVEYANVSRDLKRLATEYFSLRENEWLRGQPVNSFYMLWVLKEAWLKAVGSGLAGGLDRLQCRIEPPNIDATLRDSTTCRLNLLETPSAFVGLATTDTSEDELSISKWDPATDQLVDSSCLREIASGTARLDDSPR
jgi:4'-phosphopantetheinyl transferase